MGSGCGQIRTPKLVGFEQNCLRSFLPSLAPSSPAVLPCVHQYAFERGAGGGGVAAGSSADVGAGVGARSGGVDEDGREGEGAGAAAVVDVDAVVDTDLYVDVGCGPSVRPSGELEVQVCCTAL